MQFKFCTSWELGASNHEQKTLPSQTKETPMRRPNNFHTSQMRSRFFAPSHPNVPKQGFCSTC